MTQPYTMALMEYSRSADAFIASARVLSSRRPAEPDVVPYTVGFKLL